MSQNTALKNLDCEYNQLTSLDVSSNTELSKLECNDNRLTSLDLTGCSALQYLECDNNQLTELDLTGLEGGANTLTSLKAMFAAVFFVSIGLLVDPVQCCANLPDILIVSLVVVVGKFLNCTLAALFTGQDLKGAVQMGFGLAQIGEFAFLVAMLYVSLTGDTSTPMYQIVVAVSIVTTLLNPLMIRLSDPVAECYLDHDDDQKRHNKKCDHTVPETAQHFLIGMLRASPSSAWSLLFCLFHNLSPYFLLIQS